MNETTNVQQKNGHVVAKQYQRRTAAPPVDVFENADELLIVADVPGVANDGIDLRVENDTLTLVARPPAADVQRSPALVREFDEVDFAATYRIPAGIDTAAIAAETKNGTLVVRLPKAAAAKARTIVVRSGGNDKGG
ncbi:MAG TPA: Hsp20/alpha crystallin family protein [Polyangiaceae bacterium]|jgi:HSP20 family molecular chaperone IbpA